MTLVLPNTDPPGGQRLVPDVHGRRGGCVAGRNRDLRGVDHHARLLFRLTFKRLRDQDLRSRRRFEAGHQVPLGDRRIVLLGDGARFLGELRRALCQERAAPLPARGVDEEGGWLGYHDVEQQAFAVVVHLRLGHAVDPLVNAADVPRATLVVVRMLVELLELAHRPEGPLGPRPLDDLGRGPHGHVLAHGPWPA